MRYVAERRAHAMGTVAHVIVVGTGADLLLDSAFDRIDALEQKWSRFRPDSEVSRLNARNGDRVFVSDDTLLLMAHAATACRLTNEAFNPTMERQLVAAGYDRSFDILEGTLLAESPTPAIASPNIHIDDQCRTVALAPGTGFDAGGIGKGLTADIVTNELLAAGALGVLVSIGGDLAVKGVPPEGHEWVIEIREPAISRESITTVSLVEGALATSTTAKRRWLAGEREQHHILDPSTGQPVTNGAILVSVIAAEAWWAEAAATALVVGEDLDSKSCAWLSVMPDGVQHRHGGFGSYE